MFEIPSLARLLKQITLPNTVVGDVTQSSGWIDFIR